MALLQNFWNNLGRKNTPEEARRAAAIEALGRGGAAMIQASGPSRMPVSFAQALGANFGATSDSLAQARKEAMARAGQESNLATQEQARAIQQAKFDEYKAQQERMGGLRGLLKGRRSLTPSDDYTSEDTPASQFGAGEQAQYDQALGGAFAETYPQLAAEQRFAKPKTGPWKTIADKNSPTGFSYQDLANPNAPPIPNAQAPRLGEAYSKAGLFSDKTGEKYHGSFDKKNNAFTYTRLSDGKRFTQQEMAGRELDPVTVSSEQRQFLDAKGFEALRDNLYADMNSIDNLNKYVSTVGDMNVGLERLSDDISGRIKTMLSQGLTLKELATMESAALFQGLIGASREEVVGPGVMTEQDAKRVVQALGGNPGALQNPVVMQRIISRILKQKVRRFNSKVRSHNYNLQMGGRRGAYEPFKAFKLPKPASASDVDAAEKKYLQ